MMRNVTCILSAASFLLLSACDTNDCANACTVYGEVADRSLDNTYLTVRNYDAARKADLPTDSVKVENGRFVFSARTDKPRLMVVRNANRILGQFIAEQGEIRFAVDPSREDFSQAEISGTRINDDYQKMVVGPMNAYRREMATLEKWKRERIEANSWTSEDAGTYSQKSPDLKVARKIEKRKMAFIDKYIRQFDVVEELLVEYAYTESAWAKSAGGYSELESIYNPFSKKNARWKSRLTEEERARLTEAVEAVVSQLKKMTRHPEDTDPDEIIPDEVRIGRHFIDFERITAEGKPFSLKKAVESNRGVMLDFWVSPNRSMLPNIGKLHEKYKDRGLLVVGVSLDSDEDLWRETIGRLDMEWPQVRSYGNDTIHNIYGVRFMPHIVLIDRKGTIVARKLRGSDLEEKIVEMLN